MRAPRPSRREAVAAILAAGAGLHPARNAAAAPMPRVAAAGWAGAQTLLALGVVPLALPEIARYRALVAEPPLPESVQELGLRSEPNLELLTALAPDLIVADAGSVTSPLARIAPVATFAPLRPGRRPAEAAREATLALAARLGRDAEAQSLIAAHEARLAGAAERLSGDRGGPLCLVSDAFGNRALVFGGNSLYQDVLDRVGLRNAFTGATSAWGHATVGLDQLAALDPTTRLVLLTSRVPDARTFLALRPLWRTLPFLREERVTVLADILFYGGLPSADRFARLLAERLAPGNAARG